MKKNVVFAIILTFLPLYYSVLNAQQINSAAQSNYPQPPANVHPRLMFTEKSLEVIKENFSAEENKSAFSKYYASIDEDRVTKGSLAAFSNIESSGTIWDKREIDLVENAAFHAAVEKGNPELAKKYSDFAYNSYIGMTKIADFTRLYTSYRNYGYMVLLGAEIYDWCYDFLDKTQKNLLSSSIEKMASHQEIGWPPVHQGAITGHGAEAQLLRNLLAYAIAVYDEKPSVWKTVAGKFYSEYVEPRKFYYQSGTPSSQGAEYTSYRSTFDIWSALLITRMFDGENDPYDGKISNWIETMCYHKRPDGQFWRIGDELLDSSTSLNKKVQSYNNRYGANLLLGSSLTKNAVAKRTAFEYLGGFDDFPVPSSAADDLVSPIQFLIFNDPKIDISYSVAQTEKKNALYLDYPCGEYFATGNYSDKNSPAVRLKIGQKFQANHEHADFGSFQIFCGQLLTGNSGAYESGKDYSGKPHTKQYYHSTIAHNCLLVEPGKSSLSPTNYGGQLPLPDAKYTSDWDERYERGKVLEHKENLKKDETGNAKGFVYIKGDLTKAYSYSTKVLRSMCAVFTGDKKNPLLFFCLDEIAAKSGAKGVFLMHTQKAPEVSENKTTVYPKNTSDSQPNLYCTTLLPKNPEISVVGGPGKEFFIVNKNISSKYNVDKLQKGLSEIGWGRIEIRDSNKKSKETTFFNSMIVSNEGAGNVPEAEYIETEHYFGAIYKIGENSSKKAGCFFKKTETKNEKAKKNGEKSNASEDEFREEILKVCENFDSENIFIF